MTCYADSKTTKLVLVTMDSCSMRWSTLKPVINQKVDSDKPS